MRVAFGKRFARILASVALVPLVVSGAHAAGGIGDLYITSDASNIVRAYDGTTGNFLGNHAPSVNALGQLAIHFGAANGRFLVGSFGGGVDEFDAASGAWIKTYNPNPADWQWSAIYAPTGGVYVSCVNTNSVKEYDATTGAFIRNVCPVFGPADMLIGPNGHLYICSYMGGFVEEVNAITGAFINQYPQAGGDRTNDIAFLPNGDPLVTVMGSNVFYHYDTSWNLLGAYAGTGWFRPHGITIGPSDGKIYAVDGVTTQVHVFDPVTFAELNPSFRNPDPEDKIVDLEFRPLDVPTPTVPSTWSKIKTLLKTN